MKILIGFAVVLITVQAQATQIPFKALTNLVAEADHVLVGAVIQVDMVDGKGNHVTNETARTCPGSENQLRLHVAVATNGVIASTAINVPEKLVILLWQRWFDTLGNRRKEVEGKSFIFLLKGAAFQPVYFGGFMRELSERAEIERLLKEKPTQNQASEAIGAQGAPQPQR